MDGDLKEISVWGAWLRAEYRGASLEGILCAPCDLPQAQEHGPEKRGLPLAQ